MNKLKVALIQITSVLDPEVNLKKINDLISQATQAGAEAVFLPEMFYSITDMTAPTPYLIEGENEHFQNIRKIAIDHKIYLLGGTVSVKEGDKIKNRTFNFDPQGNLLSIYDKKNLFSVDLKESDKKTVIDEAKIYTPGDKFELTTIGEFKLGMSICFDLRFPEHYRKLSHMGANVLSICSAFTVPTGKAHWETLLRARAIENQCYVIACDQYGQHNDKVSTWGHSMIIDPWGEILVDLGEGEKFGIAEISIEKVKEVRKRLNVIRDPASV